MTLRARVATTAAAAVAIAVLLVGGLTYAATARQIDRGLDRELAAAATQLRRLDATQLERLLDVAEDPRRPAGSARDRLRERLPAGFEEGRFLGPLGGGIVRVTGPDLDSTTFGDGELPAAAEVERIAGATSPDPSPSFYDATIDGRDVRVVVLPLDDGGAVEVAAAADVDAPALEVLRRQLVVAGGLGAVLAAGLGLLVAGGAVRPVRRLTETAESVGRTGDLTTRIEVAGDDELGRLATSFNGMLASLERSREAQQQLVADASHELRTPLTSLRTNIEVLQFEERLPPDDRHALLRDVTAQLDEFGRLVDGLVELARGAGPARAPTLVGLGQLVADAVERAAVFHPAVPITLVADDSRVVAERDRLERAVSNLLDNALKHGDGSAVEVAVDAGTVRIRDHGPGIDDDDAPHVFDRFYRAPSARSLPGSGLGLSIVAQVAESHGGTVRVSTHPDGGAVVSLSLPLAAAAATRRP